MTIAIYVNSTCHDCSYTWSTYSHKFTTKTFMESQSITRCLSNDRLTSTSSWYNLSQMLEHVKPVWFFSFPCYGTDQCLGLRIWLFQRGVLCFYSVSQVKYNLFAITWLWQESSQNLIRNGNFFTSSYEWRKDSQNWLVTCWFLERA